MSSTDTLLKAIINRLSVRFGDVISEVSSGFEAFAKKAPERMRKEWSLFQEEVWAEANRLDKDSELGEENNSVGSRTVSVNESTQEKIDRLRGKVAKLNSEVETWR